MRVGVPKEIKNHEYRVGMTPASVAELVASGHEVFVETQAGMGIDFEDSAYEKVGATILPTAADVFKSSDMIVKVKEPQPVEIAMLEPQAFAVHLPPPRRRQAAGRRADEIGRDLHCL